MRNKIIEDVIRELRYQLDNKEDTITDIENANEDEDAYELDPCNSLFEWYNTVISLLPNNISLGKAQEIEETLKKLIKEY